MSGNDHEAIRERSHMLNTCPSKAGLPPFPSLLSPAIRNDLAAEGERVDSSEVDDSARSSGGVHRGGRGRGKEIMEGGCRSVGVGIRG